MLGILILSTVGAIVVTVVFAGLIWAAVQDGRKQARIDALTGARTATARPAVPVPASTNSAPRVLGGRMPHPA